MLGASPESIERKAPPHADYRLRANMQVAHQMVWVSVRARCSGIVRRAPGYVLSVFTLQVTRHDLHLLPMGIQVRSNVNIKLPLNSLHTSVSLKVRIHHRTMPLNPTSICQSSIL